MPVPTTWPVPSLGGAHVRYRPVTTVQLNGPGGTKVRDALLDTGADDTIFPVSLAQLLGIDLTQAAQRLLHLAGRPQPIPCHFAPVAIRLTDGVSESYEWTAVVGFVASRLHYNLLGHAGCLQFFDVTFRGEPDFDVVLNSKPSFPGRRMP